MSQSGFLNGDILYDILIRLTSSQLIRCPLFEGQGYFGWWNDETGEFDYAADACFTAARLTPLGERIAWAIEERHHSPFPFPALLVEGWEDDNVHIPPHNLSEVIDACLAMMDEPNISLDELMDYIQGPDFPNVADITTSASVLKKIYKTGKGRLTLRYENGKNRYVNVRMCALGNQYRYADFNLQKYLQVFIQESRKNIKEFANAMLTRLDEKEKLVNDYVVIRDHFEEIVTIARKSLGEENFRRNLTEELRLTEEQSQLAMDFNITQLDKLYKITPIQQRISREKQRYKQLAESRQEIDRYLRHQLEEIKARFADERRTGFCRENVSNNSIKNEK